MKFKLPSLLLALATAGIFSPSAHAVATADGDLLIGFYQIITGSVQPKTYIFRLGKAATYRENTQSNALVSAINTAPGFSANIGPDLAALFGDDWMESGTVYWTIFGGASQNTVGVVDGDRANCSYISAPCSSFVVGQSTSAFTGISGSPRSKIAVSIESIRTYANGGGSLPVTDVGPPIVYLSGANASGAQINTAYTSTIATVDQFLPPAAPNGEQIGQASEKRGLFGSGTLTNSGTIEGALDIYRYINVPTGVTVANSGLDLTSGFGTALSSSGTSALGVGQYCGTFTIDTDGNLRVFGTPPVIPSYYSFATANSPNLAGGPNADADNDGINNLTEYALNTNLSGSDGSVGTLSGGVLSFTKRAAAVTNGDLTYSIEISTDLGITVPWAPLGGVTNNSTTISGTLPAGLPKQFARLKVLSSAVAP